MTPREARKQRAADVEGLWSCWACLQVCLGLVGRPTMRMPAAASSGGCAALILLASVAPTAAERKKVSQVRAAR